MEIYPSLLFRLLGYSFLCGICLGALYDVIRLSRVFFGVCHYTAVSYSGRFRPPISVRPWKMSRLVSDIFICLQDIGFCLTVGICASILLFYYNSGGFRGFVLPTLLVGFAVYYVTIGKLAIRVSEHVVFWIKTVLIYLVYFISKPVSMLWRVLKRAVSRIYGNTILRLGAWLCRRRQIAVEKKLLEWSENGFFGFVWKENGTNKIYRSK